jgi:hypothetical protein
MRFALCIALAVLGLEACASHNSHRVDIDLASEFDPLVDEAYAQLMTQWPPDEPGGGIATRVSVEPVTVRWAPRIADPAAPAPPVEQAALAQRVEKRLRELTGGAPDPSQPPNYWIEAELETDLHDPGSITFGLTCSLESARDRRVVLARGYSRLVQLPRLFCHGCNERWSGLGTRLAPPSSEAGHDHDYGGFWAGVFFCPPSSSSGSTYTKVR